MYDYADYLEAMILNSRDRESDDCANCEFKGVTTCKNQCAEINYNYLKTEVLK